MICIAAENRPTGPASTKIHPSILELPPANLSVGSSDGRPAADVRRVGEHQVLPRVVCEFKCSNLRADARQAGEVVAWRRARCGPLQRATPSPTGRRVIRVPARHALDPELEFRPCWVPCAQPIRCSRRADL